MKHENLKSALTKIGCQIDYEVDLKRGYIYTAKKNDKSITWAVSSGQVSYAFYEVGGVEVNCTTINQAKRRMG